jgi:hypothetical protein
LQIRIMDHVQFLVPVCPKRTSGTATQSATKYKHDV